MSRSEKSDSRQSEQADWKMNIAIRVEQSSDRASRSEHIELKGMIRLQRCGVKPSGEKLGGSDCIKNITKIENSFAKREE